MKKFLFNSPEFLVCVCLVIALVCYEVRLSRLQKENTELERKLAVLQNEYATYLSNGIAFNKALIKSLKEHLEHLAK